MMQSDTRSRLDRERREQALKEALRMERVLQLRVRGLKLEDESKHVHCRSAKKLQCKVSYGGYRDSEGMSFVTGAP